MCGCLVLLIGDFFFLAWVLLCPSGPSRALCASSAWCSLDSHLQSSRLISRRFLFFFLFFFASADRPNSFNATRWAGPSPPRPGWAESVSLSSPTTSTVHVDVNGSYDDVKRSCSRQRFSVSHPPTRRKTTTTTTTRQ